MKRAMIAVMVGALFLTGCAKDEEKTAPPVPAPTAAPVSSEEPEEDEDLIVGIDPESIETPEEAEEVWGDLADTAAQDGLEAVEALTSTSDLWGGKRDYDPLYFEVMREHMTPQTYDALVEDAEDGELTKFNHFLFSTIEDGQFPSLEGEPLSWEDGEETNLLFQYTTPTLTIVQGSAFEDGEDRLALSGSIKVEANDGERTSVIVRDYTFNMLPSADRWQIDWAAGETRYPREDEQ